MKTVALLILVAAGVVLNSSGAFADPRVVPGAEIMLDVTNIAGPAAVGQIANQCLYEQTMKSLLPAVWAAHTSSDTIVTITGIAETDEDTSGTSTTPFSMVLPRIESKTSYVEWTDPTTSVRHFANFDATTSGYYSNTDTDLTVSLHTDAEGPTMDIGLEMYPYLPRLEFKGVASETCVDNNWGRSICTPSGTLTDAKLVVPQEFVATDFWQNYNTGSATKKQFDFADYADCLLYKWENPALLLKARHK